MRVRERHLLALSIGLSPSLIVRDGKAHLSVPFKLHPKKLTGDVVCAVDVGINTTATATIVGSDGTVIRAKILSSRGRHRPSRQSIRADSAQGEVNQEAAQRFLQGVVSPR
jgi:hypothetical protein